MHSSSGSENGIDAGWEAPQGLRVLIASEDAHVRRVMRDGLPGVLVVGEAHDAREALGATRYYQPEVVVIDAELRGSDPMDLVQRLATDACTGAKLVLLCVPERRDLAYAGLRKGVLGCVDKRTDLASLRFVLREVGEGRAALSPSIVCDLARELRALPHEQVGVRPVRSVLTGREWETVDQLCLGRSTQEIATALGLSAETVRMHIKNIMRKLDVHSRAEIVAAVQELRAREVLSHAAVLAAAVDGRQRGAGLGLRPGVDTSPT